MHGDVLRYLFLNRSGVPKFAFICLQQVCGVDWSLVYDSCYHLLRGSVTQSTAQNNCLGKGGNLALVSSAEELAAIQAFIQSEGIGSTGVWVDGSDAAEEGVWRTASGEVMTYFGWTGVEPNGGTIQNCMMLWGVSVVDNGCYRADLAVAALCEL